MTTAPTSTLPATPTAVPALAPPAATTKRRGWPRLWEHALAFVLGACAVLVAQSAWRLVRPPEPLSLAPGGVDLNRADVGTLRQLPGVGPHLAARIVDHRTRQGPFGSVEDLRAVQGIGPATLERLRPVVFVTSETEPDAKGTPSLPARSSTAKALPQQPLDLNTATREDLMTLPGLGPTLAERIVADRTTNGPFRTVQELTRVRGIKAKTLEKLTPYLKVVDNAVKPS